MSRKVTATMGHAAGQDMLDGSAKIKIHSIVGGHNFVGNHGDIHVQITSPAKLRPRIVIQPGQEHISEEQKIELASLRNEWMALHASIKTKPMSHATAWAKINRAAGATSYHLILAIRFADAVAFIKQEMAKLRNMSSAPAKDSSWRARKIGAIKARCSNQLGDPRAYTSYIQRNFGAESLSELATDELQKTYAYVMAKKGAKKPAVQFNIGTNHGQVAVSIVNKGQGK